MSTPESDGGACRVCGRSCLAHVSGACRSCRRGKPDSWVARKKTDTAPTGPILSDEERAPLQPRGWRERSQEQWKRRSTTTP